MLFVAEYELSWDMLEAAIAKRLEWDDAKPDGFRFVGEYVWQDREPPFRGVAVIDADNVEALNSFVLHYGPTLKVRMHAASDVVSGIALVRPGGARRVRKDRKKARRVANPLTSRTTTQSRGAQSPTA